MPPARPTGATDRKAFKPPRPAAKPKASAKSAPKSRKSGSKRPATSLSSSDDEVVQELSEAEAPDEVDAPPSTQDPPLTIPPKLLTKLLHHHFKDEKVRIGKDANALIGKYMETFVKEAIARAAFERAEVEGGKGRGDFLEVRLFLLT